MTFHHVRTPRLAAVPPAARGLPGPLALALRELSATVALPKDVLARNDFSRLADAILTLRAADPAFDLNPDLRALRRALADRIEADIAVLDLMGGDPDLEPSLGAGEPFTAGPAHDWDPGSRDDREAEHDGREPDAEAEATATEWSGRGPQRFNNGWAA